MATRKISLTLDEALLAELRAQVGPRGVSSYVDEAVRDRLDSDRRRQALIQALDELDELDPPTDEERAAGERWADELTARFGR